MVLRDRSPGPADRVRPRLRPLNRRHRAGPEAFPGGPGEGGTREPARSGQERAAVFYPAGHSLRDRYVVTVQPGSQYIQKFRNY